MIYRSFSKTGGDRLLWKLDANRLRILCYHGICEDRLAGEPWMPPFFVTESAFENQLRYLSRNAQVLPLSEAITKLRDGALPAHCVSVTFDDGYANNLRLAYPLLKRYGIPATIFLATAYVESGNFFPFLQSKFIGPGSLNYQSTPIDVLLQSTHQSWLEAKAGLNHDQLQTLRPLTAEDVRTADHPLIDFGAHSHTHCIFKNETDSRRREEIQTSLRKVSQWIRRPVRLFSYPNGERGDFGEQDKQVLRSEGVQAAVTGIAGANGRRSELLALRRYPMSLYHDESGFRSEVTGFRSTLLAASRRRAS